MHEAVLAFAARPAAVRCLGLRLKPFSIGHHLLLQRQEIPDFSAIKPEAFADKELATYLKVKLAQAVIICHRSWRECENKERWVRLWMLTNRKRDWIEESRKFGEYVKQGSESFPNHPPRKGENSGEMRYIGAPEAIRVYHWLVAHLPPRELYAYGDSAWDYPFGLARCHLETQLEQDGSLEIYNYRDWAHDRAVKEMSEEFGPEVENA